jgi:hypothetical protein
MTNTYKGKYQVKNPEKYKGNPNNVVFRSSWELKFFNYCDKNPDILQWASEEPFMVVPYKSPIDGKWHRYFPDVWIKTANDTFLVEIKPFKETQEPKKRSRVTKKYLYEVKTWGINSSKWKAAQDFCADRKWKFKIITEKEMKL